MLKSYKVIKNYTRYLYTLVKDIKIKIWILRNDAGQKYKVISLKYVVSSTRA